nr:hypothetical protein [Tanacetum cinerariifolium]
EALVPVYNRFAQLMNDLERNDIKFPLVTGNTNTYGFLFQTPSPYYVTHPSLVADHDDDFQRDVFQNNSEDPITSAMVENKLEKSHDPLALVAYTSSFSRIPSPYYVTHPSLVVDYDDDYQGDAFQSNYEDPLTSAMMLLARAIT